jgi:uncharacterized protein YutE (UPF0331/DUF86 family)
MIDPALITPTGAGVPEDFFKRKAADLAADIVCEIDTAANLARKYGLDDVQWDCLRAWPAFRKIIAQAYEELSGPAGVHERAKRKAALAIESVGILDMATIMGDKKALPKDRISAFNALKEVGAMDGKSALAAAQAGMAGVGGPLIQIFFPNQPAPINIGVQEPIIDAQYTQVEKQP